MRNNSDKSSEIALVFVRAPEPGRVKTRLARDLGDERALTLYQAFVARVLGAASSWSEAAHDGETRDIWICYTPDDRIGMMRDWLGRERTFLAQAGETLGERMALALALAFDAGACKALLVGSDIPDLTPGHLEQASQALASTEVVLGPSLDGGYWLVGSTREGFSREIFKDIPWGGSTVFSDTMRRCKLLQRSVATLSYLRDVDTVSDLKQTRYGSECPP